MDGVCVRLLLGWLRGKGLAPDSGTAVVLQGLGCKAFSHLLLYHLLVGVFVSPLLGLPSW
jgi:hypothetical protein